MADDPEAGAGQDPKPKVGGDPDPKLKPAAEAGKDGEAHDPERAQRLIDKLRTEAKLTAQEREELAAAKAKLEAIELADQTETQKLAAAATKSEAERAKLEGERNALAEQLAEQQLQNLILVAIGKGGDLAFRDPEDALSINRELLARDETTNEVTTASVEKALKDLLTRKPHYKADGADGAKPPAKEIPATRKPGEVKPPGPADEADKKAKTDRLYQRDW